MSKHPGVSQTLDLLERLRAAVSDLIAQRRQLEADFQTRNAGETRRFTALMTTERGQVEARLQAADATEQASLAQFERWIAQRKQRLQKARRGARRAAMDRIEREEGRYKYTVQKGTLDAERAEKEATALNEGRHQEFLARFSQEQENFAAQTTAAATAFRGYRGFRQALTRPPAAPLAASADRDETGLLDTAAGLIGQAAAGLRQFRKHPIPLFFRFVPLWLLLTIAALAALGTVWVLPRFGGPGLEPARAGGLFGAVAVGLGLLFLLGKKIGAPLAGRIASALSQAGELQANAHELATTRHGTERARIAAETHQTQRQLEDLWHRAAAEARRARDEWPQVEAEKAGRVNRRWEALEPARRNHWRRTHEADRLAIRTAAELRQQPLIAEHERREAQLRDERASRQAALEADRRQRLDSLWAEINGIQASAAVDFPAWIPERWRSWRPPGQFGNAASLGEVQVKVAQLAGVAPEELPVLPGSAEFTLPLVLTYPSGGSLLLETGRAGAEAAADTLNQVLLRLLATTPPGKLNFTIIDPVRLGQNFAGVMHLADFEENLINRRIWTQPAEIEQQLADLSAHMEKVIQMYLRNEYATIAEYNVQAGNIAEQYHFLVLADFPANFSDVALRRLVNIASSGARCGVYTLIHWDRQQPAPPDFVVTALRQNSVVLVQAGAEFTFTGTALPGIKVQLAAAPAPDLTTEFLRLVGTYGRDAGRVRVPFAQAAPASEAVWSLETTEELRVPIGRTGATKLQFLALGKGTRQHALVAGKTGSGKSTLFHVIITNLALWSSPDQVEFYLVDFKKGVEFKCYGAQRLPHARVVAIESDREFGLSVLQKLDDELRRRGDLFRQLGVQDLAGHRGVTGGKPLPRALLLIDEFQEFFVEDDRVSQTAAVLLDRIVRQGRAFGIHVILGSQTLGGAYTLARTTLGQMVVRIALQCNEADALLIMDDTNPAPRLLTRPGEGIYNDMAGMVEGNSPFQTVWLDDQERDGVLAGVRRRADATGRGGLAPFVFEGNAPAGVRDNMELERTLKSRPTLPPAEAQLWLGAPNAIKGPTAATFRRQSGRHLLLVGQREDAELAIVTVGLLGLAAQFPPGTARFILLDSTAPGSSQQHYLQEVIQALPEPATVGRAGELVPILSALTDELKRRTENPAADSPATFFFLHGLQHFKKLMPEDEFSFTSNAGGEVSPANLLKDLLSGGPVVGIHVIATCDSYNNLNRYLGRKPLADFGLRVLFQMSANDSSSLIDNPKANTLGMHRALLHHEAEGWLETFRPYALPDGGWIGEVKAALAVRR